MLGVRAEGKIRVRSLLTLSMRGPLLTYSRRILDSRGVLFL